ncbi:MAG: hypothetical protein DRP74_08070 [Candidatus Omnitrophota bacterium]|nr:MAG: hypothetical protein DRP74_08070 [Candidatus Omnitrophota bacterium]
MWYKINFKPKSGVISDLSADILWGHLIWGLVYSGRGDLVKDIISSPKNMLCSSIFIEKDSTGGIFIPALNIPAVTEISALDNSDDSTDYKKLKKIPYIPMSLLKAIAGDFSIRVYLSKLKDYVEKERSGFFRAVKNFHNTINRLNGTVLEKGGFFAREEKFLIKGYSFTAFINWEYEKNLLADLLSLVSAFGYGADSNAGKGHILFDRGNGIKELNPGFFGDRNSSDAVVLLSHCAVCDKEFDLSRSFYKLKTKIGRLGGSYAGRFPYFKRSVVLLREGSVIAVKGKKDFYGDLIRGVHIDKDIVHYGIGVPYWVNTGE